MIFVVNTNITKLLNNESILIERNNAGWKFTCNHKNFGVETGLYFGKKDSFTENKNIYVNGEITKEREIIKWEIKRI